MTQSSPYQAIDLTGLTGGFFNSVANGTVEIYNEFSLQHELGPWLRLALPSSYKVQFERNISYFGIERLETSLRRKSTSLFLTQKWKKSTP